MLKSFPEIIFGLSEKKDGKMRLSSREPDVTALNRHNFLNYLGIDPEKMVSAVQADGVQVKVVGQEEVGAILAGVDVLITQEKGLALAIAIADCAPIYFYDPVKKVIALAHAGWRDVQGGIIDATIQAFQKNFQSEAKDLQVFVGPHLRACHFEVQSEVAEKFSSYPQFIINRAGKTYVDLAGIIMEQLLTAGLEREKLEFSPECTYCEGKKYFSWRRDKPNEVEAMVAYISLK